ncbi:mycothiol system anti-sigma-R factor [Cellulomonas sp. P22]|uniref:mycothiol system anti-sigma-R factor n=1 Tax=Cellulomonas sp. P22 TaxID=3373189 RepID=UPI0037B50E8F
MSIWEPPTQDEPSATDEPLAAAPRVSHEHVGGCGDGCAEALDRLFEYLDSELAEPDQERVRAHLEECRPCFEEYDVEIVVKNLVRRCCQEEAPLELRARIRDQMTFLRAHQQ